jgi:hypothetical protein
MKEGKLDMQKLKKTKKISMNKEIKYKERKFVEGTEEEGKENLKYFE